MTATHLTLTLIASIAALGGAVLNLTGHRIPVTEAQRLSVPLEWLRFPIGASYALGFLGLLVGLAVPAVGIVAAAGFVVFFVLAIGAHLRAGGPEPGPRGRWTRALVGHARRHRDVRGGAGRPFDKLRTSSRCDAQGRCSVW